MNLTEFIDKLMDILRCKKYKELAKKLGVEPSTISSWKKRNSMDFDIFKNILAICEKKHIDLYWLLGIENKPEVKTTLSENEIRKIVRNEIKHHCPAVPYLERLSPSESQEQKTPISK